MKYTPTNFKRPLKSHTLSTIQISLGFHRLLITPFPDYLNLYILIVVALAETKSGLILFHTWYILTTHLHEGHFH